MAWRNILPLIFKAEPCFLCLYVSRIVLSTAFLPSLDSNDSPFKCHAIYSLMGKSDDRVGLRSYPRRLCSRVDCWAPMDALSVLCDVLKANVVAIS